MSLNVYCLKYFKTHITTIQIIYGAFCLLNLCFHCFNLNQSVTIQSFHTNLSLSTIFTPISCYPKFSHQTVAVHNFHTNMSLYNDLNQSVFIHSFHTGLSLYNVFIPIYPYPKFSHQSVAVQRYIHI